MNKLFIVLFALMASTSLAQEGYQVEIQAEFVAFDKAALDQLANAKPNQVPDLQTLSQLRKEGKATVLYALRLITKSGAEAEVQAMEEVIYPTDFSIDMITNLPGKTATVISQTDFETRNVGGYLEITPVVAPDFSTIDLTLNAQIVASPTWRNYPAKHIDSTGTERTADFQQPFFHSRRVLTSIAIKSGQTVIVGGGMNDLDNKTTTFLFITARLVDSEGKPIQTGEEEKTPIDHDTLPGDAAVKAPAEQFKKTVVTPYLDCRIGKGTNLLWCATFQLAWDQLCGFAGGPVQFDPPIKDCDILNNSKINTNDLDASSYIAVAGLGTQALDSIKKELQTRFAGAARPQLLPSSLEKDEWIAYAYLFQHLPFKCAFTRIDFPLTFAGVKVASFGIEQYLPTVDSNEVEMAKQVIIYDYRSDDDFIVELEPTNRLHRVILAQIPPAGNLSALINTVQTRINQAAPTSMAEAATLQIPIIDFDIQKTYSHFEGGGIITKDPKMTGTLLAVAMQSIRFRLDEKGTVLKSEGIAAACMGQTLVFRKPFLVLLQKRGAQTPYFALWVANAELLTRFRRQNTRVAP